MDTPAIDRPGLRDYHDYMVRHLDDTAQVNGYEQAGQGSGAFPECPFLS